MTKKTREELILEDIERLLDETGKKVEKLLVSWLFFDCMAEEIRNKNEESPRKTHYVC